MKAHVSTMLTESGLSIALALRQFKGRCDEMGGCKPTSTAFRGLFVLTARDTPGHGMGHNLFWPHQCLDLNFPEQRQGVMGVRRVVPLQYMKPLGALTQHILWSRGVEQGL